MLQNLQSLAKLTKKKSKVGFQLPEDLYQTPEKFLESITQKINVYEAIYKCVDVRVLPVTSIEDEYVVVVFEIMGPKLRQFYGGQYLVQQWAKKQKIFQAVHNCKPLNFFLTQQRFIYSLQGIEEECKQLYVVNFYQGVFQKINHPFFSTENPDGIHDISIYVDPKQVIVVNGQSISWAQLKIENLLLQTTKGGGPQQNEEGKLTVPDLANLGAIQQKQKSNIITEEETSGINYIVEHKVEYVNVLENCSSHDLPSDIIKVHCVANEGFLRKEIHFVIETELKIHVFALEPVKVGLMQSFDVETHFEFEKSFAEIGVTEEIRSITLESYGDEDNLIVILKKSGESKMMSEAIMKMMIDYANSIKQAQEEEESSEDEEEKARLAALEAQRRQLWYRMTKICRRETYEDLIPKKKNKGLVATNQTLSAIRNFWNQQAKAHYMVVNKYFIRRQQIYFLGDNGEIKRIKINQIKNTDATLKASKVNYQLDVAMLQDITLHLNTFNDFLIANTTLIISHQKILSIYDFLTNQWNHMLPSEQGNTDQEQGQTYFGMPDDEIDSLLLNYIFSNSIYDCIIMYRGKFIRRLKYYNELDKTYFEKGKIFENQNVLQLQRNVDARNYRQYGDSTIRTLFMIEDKIMQNQQIWVSENGSRITKLVDQIPIDLEWQLVDIPNARSDMLIIHSRKEKTITIYNIPDSKQCLYPSQLAMYQTHKLEKIEYDTTSKIQYFLFKDKIYFQQDGNLMVLHLKGKESNKLKEINFNKTIKELYMTHEESVYYKDKNNIFRFAQLQVQKEFNIDKQPTEVQNCRGAFCTKLEYSITTNRIALFTSSFEISIIPLLDRYRIDLMASQDFEQNFICWKEIDNTLIALKKPNILVSWNTDTGKIVGYHELNGMDFTKYTRHTEWNGATLLKQMKEAKAQNQVKEEVNERYEDDSNVSFDFDQEEADEKAAEDRIKLNSNPDAHTYSLIEIKSATEVVQHCSFLHDFKPGTYLYVSFPYLLVMDEFCTRQYLLEGKYKFKTMRLMHTFYEPQMKLGKPIYFSPNFFHRLFIDPQTKEIILNFTLTNANIYSLPIRKKILFQIEKTHPMIYFHDNENIVYVTNQGVERMFQFKTTVATRRRKATCQLIETANIYYNEKTFVRRFILDPLNFNPQQASQMKADDILKFRGDVLKRNLQLNIYKTNNTDQEKPMIPRYYSDKNISQFTHFIINNYRQQISFNYLTWKMIDQLANKKIQVSDLSPKFIQELSHTILPDNRNIYHLFSQEYEVLDEFIRYVNNEDIEKEMQEEIELTDILFIPDLKGKTPLHLSLAQNNTRVTDRFVSALSHTDFDHHSRFILEIYPMLIEQVPQSMSTYLDSRLKAPSWIEDYTRGRIEADNDCGFVMTADKMWSENLDASLQGKIYKEDVLEVPLTMEILDLPHLHKYKNDIADDFLEQLAETECIEIFSNSSIQALIEIKWPLVKAAIKKFLFYPYLVFLFSFLYYTVVVFENYQTQKHGGTGSPEEALILSETSIMDNFKIGIDIEVPNLDQLKDPEYWLSHQMIILKVIIQCFAIYFFLIEVRQMFVSGLSKHLASPWNYLDIIPLILITVSLSFENFGFNPVYERPLNAVACFFMWIKFLYFWRLFRQTSKFISMIVAIIGDLQVFLLVFLVTLTAFGNAMYIMSNNNPICDEECEKIPEEERDPGRFIHSIFDSIFFSYRMSLGDFDTEDLGSVHYLLVIITFIMATLFLTIMMLNILIAVISDSYARVENTSIEEMYKNFADLIAENEYLVYDQRLEDHDDMGDYLYIAKMDQTDDGEGEAWEGKLEDVKKNMVKKTEGIETLLKEAQKTLINTVHQQTDTYIAYLKEQNIKHEQKLQQCVRKIDGGASQKRGRKESNAGQTQRQSIIEEQKEEAPQIQDKRQGSFFLRKVSKMASNAQKAINEMQGSLRQRGLGDRRKTEQTKTDNEDFE